MRRTLFFWLGILSAISSGYASDSLRTRYVLHPEPLKPFPEYKFRRIHLHTLNQALYMYSLNPAFTGLGDPHIFSMADIRYPGQHQFPIAAWVGYDQPVWLSDEHTLALGYWGGYERSGIRWEMKHILNLAYRVKFNRQVELRLGAGAGYNYTEYDASGLTSGDMVDERYGFIYAPLESFDRSLNRPGLILNGGLSLEAYGFTANFNVTNTLRFAENMVYPQQEVRAFTTYSGSCFYAFKLTRRLVLLPSFEFTVNSLSRYGLEGGTYIQYYAKGGFIGGASYHSLQHIDITAGWANWNRVRIMGKMYIPVSSLSASYPVSGFLVQLHLNI